MEIEDINDEIRDEQHLKELFKEDEILKILDELEAYYDRDITTPEIKLIRDHITNLQEELKSANESITWWHNRFNAKNNGFKSTIEELCETTEKFEKLQEKYEKMKENAEILSKGYSDLEKRNEKAIEFMKENCDIITLNNGWIIRSELTTTGLGELFKILKGRY